MTTYYSSGFRGQAWGGGGGAGSYFGPNFVFLYVNLWAPKGLGGNFAIARPPPIENSWIRPWTNEKIVFLTLYCMLIQRGGGVPPNFIKKKKNVARMQRALVVNSYLDCPPPHSAPFLNPVGICPCMFYTTNLVLPQVWRASLVI